MKDKTLLLAKLQIRNDSITGGAIPDDEMQCDFVISTGDVDGHFSTMSDDTRRNFAEDAEKGVPFMLNHERDLTRQLGRVIAGSYDDASGDVRATISILRDTDDTPEAMRVNEYIRRIERRYYDSSSVGYRATDEICNLCGKDIWDWTRENPCPHIPGRSYEGEICTYEIRGGRLREVSLVATPSNPNAKLLDTREWSEDLLKIKTEGMDLSQLNSPQSLLEQDGLKYREGLITDAIKSGIRADDTFDEKVWRKRFESMNSEFIKEQMSLWETIGNNRWGKGGRTTESGNFTPDNSRAIAVLPDWIFS